MRLRSIVLLAVAGVLTVSADTSDDATTTILTTRTHYVCPCSKPSEAAGPSDSMYRVDSVRSFRLPGGSDCLVGQPLQRRKKDNDDDDNNNDNERKNRHQRPHHQSGDKNQKSNKHNWSSWHSDADSGDSDDSNRDNSDNGDDGGDESNGDESNGDDGGDGSSGEDSGDDSGADGSDNSGDDNGDDSGNDGNDGSDGSEGSDDSGDDNGDDPGEDPTPTEPDVADSEPSFVAAVDFGGMEQKRRRRWTHFRRQDQDTNLQFIMFDDSGNGYLTGDQDSAAAFQIDTSGDLVVGSNYVAAIPAGFNFAQMSLTSEYDGAARPWNRDDGSLSLADTKICIAGDNSVYLFTSDNPPDSCTEVAVGAQILPPQEDDSGDVTTTIQDPVVPPVPSTSSTSISSTSTSSTRSATAINNAAPQSTFKFGVSAAPASTSSTTSSSSTVRTTSTTSSVRTTSSTTSTTSARPTTSSTSSSSRTTSSTSSSHSTTLSSTVRTTSSTTSTRPTTTSTTSSVRTTSSTSAIRTTSTTSSIRITSTTSSIRTTSTTSSVRTTSTTTSFRPTSTTSSTRTTSTTSSIRSIALSSIIPTTLSTRISMSTILSISSTRISLRLTTSSTPRPTTTSTSTRKTTSSTIKVVAPSVTIDYDTSGMPYLQAVLEQHNFHRMNHTVANLTWSDSLTDTARKIAESCYYAHDVEMDGGGYGQNIGAGAPFEYVPALLTNGMYNSEINYYPKPYGIDSPDMSEFERWGHFSQMVWADTAEVGCYTQYCENGLSNIPEGYNVLPYYTVCNYYPPGNYPDQYTKVPQPLPGPTINVVVLSDEE